MGDFWDVRQFPEKQVNLRKFWVGIQEKQVNISVWFWENKLKIFGKFRRNPGKNLIKIWKTVGT